MDTDRRFFVTAFFISLLAFASLTVFPQNTVLANHCGGSCCAYESCGCPSTGCGPTSECSAETGHNPDGSCSTLGSCQVRTFGTYCGGSPNPTNTPTPTTQPTPTSQPTPTPQTYLVAGGNVFCQDPGGPKYNLPSIQILLHNDVVAAPNNNRTIFTNSGGNYSFGNIISGEVNNFLAFRVNYVPPTNTIPGTGQPYSAMILDSAPNCTNSNQCDFGGGAYLFCNALGTSYEFCGLSGTTTPRYGFNFRFRNCTPGNTPTPTTHPSVTPSVTPIPTPPAPMCHNITPLSPAPHQIGDNVSFECGLITTPYETRYEFQMQNVTAGTIESIPTSTTVANQSLPYTITQAGDYAAQCRLCYVAYGSDVEICEPWE